METYEDLFTSPGHGEDTATPTSFTTMLADTEAALPQDSFDMMINESATIQDNSNRSLNPTIPPASAPRTEQNTHVHDHRFDDQDIAQLASSIHQSLVSQTSHELTESLRDGFGNLMKAMKARMHHTGLVNRVAKFLDSFTTDPNDKTTLPADQAMCQLTNKLKAASNEKACVRQAMMKQEAEIERLRGERDFYRTKACSADQLGAYAQYLTQQLKKAQSEIGQKNKFIQSLKASLAVFSKPWTEAAPDVLSANEVIKRFTGVRPNLINGETNGSLSPQSLPPPSMQQPGQVTQHDGVVLGTQPIGTAQQNITTPSTALRSSPTSMLPTPPYKESSLYHVSSSPIQPQKGATAQVISGSTLSPAMSGKTVDLTSEGIKDPVLYGGAALQTHSFQQRSAPITTHPTPKTGYPVQGSSSPDASYFARSSFGSTNAEVGHMGFPVDGIQHSPPNKSSPMYSHNIHDQTQWAAYPEQIGHHPANEAWVNDPAAVMPQVGQKRDFQLFNEFTSFNQAAPSDGVAPINGAGPDPKSARPAKKTKINNTATEEEAPKKAPVKKAAPKKTEPKMTEPKKRAPRKTKKDKERENEWTPEMVRLQEELLHRPQKQAPTSAVPVAPEATEPIVIPDGPEEDEDDIILRDLMEAYCNDEEASVVEEAADNA
ncbi:MAG: hypothetical protein Q9209_003901 [Squamulea sp. 1 TL-2023]